MQLRERFTTANTYNFTLLSESLTHIYKKRKILNIRLPNTVDELLVIL
jgi:hypothetical protein